jgi:ribonucleotide reductase alpha subunit
LVDFSFVDNVTDEIIHKLHDFLINSDQTEFITVEHIQDHVERELMEAGHFDVMKSFIIYRNNRKKQRERAKEKVEKKLEQKSFKILKTS